MSARSRLLRTTLRLWFAAALFWPTLASAWVETVVRSHQAKVTIQRDGSAEVEQQLVIKLRGGPLEALELEGFGNQLETTAEASVSRVDQGLVGMASPVRAMVTPTGALRLEVALERGLRGGSYLFRFAYKLPLRELGYLEAHGDDVLLTFVGPRLPTGVDAAHVTFVVPHGSREPRLPEHVSGPGAGTMLNEVRRAAGSDEIDLVRAHLAVAEPASWQIVVARDALSLPDAVVAPADGGPVPVVERALRTGGIPPWAVGVALAVALAFFALTRSKASAAAEAARLRGARLRPLLPGGPTVRALVAGGAMGAAAFLAWLHQPAGAVACAGVALMAMTHLLPTRLSTPRGPGQWKKLELADIPRTAPLPGLIFEPSNWRGFGVFVLGWGSALFFAYRLLGTSTYASLMVGGLALSVVPLFWTGRHADLPEPVLVQGRHWLGYLQRKLARSSADLELWGRVPDTALDEPALGQSEMERVDEVRVRVVPRRPSPGLRALEVVLEEGAGAFVQPCVLLRALEDSEATRRLPADLSWVRGRSAEEKVALVRPALPAPRALVTVVRSLLVALDGAARSRAASEPARPTATPAAAL